MENVTQQNAALVEEVTAATLAFEEEAKRLAAEVGRFQIARGEGGSEAIATTAATGIERSRPIARRVAQIAAARPPDAPGGERGGDRAGRRGAAGRTR
jgi:methyl-accepting chemotaxis protein